MTQHQLTTVTSLILHLPGARPQSPAEMSSVEKCSSPIPISDICGSPRRVWGRGLEVGKGDVLHGSPVRDVVEEWKLVPPSSPLLAAMREAVDSINQYEDFEIFEQIGAGFFAEVYKVCGAVHGDVYTCVFVVCLLMCTHTTNTHE